MYPLNRSKKQVILVQHSLDFLFARVFSFGEFRGVALMSDFSPRSLGFGEFRGFSDFSFRVLGLGVAASSVCGCVALPLLEGVFLAEPRLDDLLLTSLSGALLVFFPLGILFSFCPFFVSSS